MDIGEEHPEITIEPIPQKKGKPEVTPAPAPAPAPEQVPVPA